MAAISSRWDELIYDKQNAVQYTDQTCNLPVFSNDDAWDRVDLKLKRGALIALSTAQMQIYNRECRWVKSISDSIEGACAKIETCKKMHGMVSLLEYPTYKLNNCLLHYLSYWSGLDIKTKLLTKGKVLSKHTLHGKLSWLDRVYALVNLNFRN